MDRKIRTQGGDNTFLFQLDPMLSLNRYLSTVDAGSIFGHLTLTSSSAGMEKRLLKAATSGDFTSLKIIVPSQDPSILLGTTPAGNTCLHISSIHGHEGFCGDVLELEESLLAAVNLDGETPLIAAVRNGHVSLASFLLRSCCQSALFRQAILRQDKNGFNALHHAIRNGHRDLALELIAAEPALSQAVSNCNESPLFFAMMRCFTDVCEKLMQSPDCNFSGGQHGGNCLPNPDFSYTGGMHGWNCLHAAVVYGDQAIAKIIMEKHPELAREATNSSTTPVRAAVLYGKIDILRVMLEHDSTLGYELTIMGDPLLLSASYRGQVAAAQELLKHCPDTPYCNLDGTTLLHNAVYNDHAEFVEFILKTPLLRKVVNMQDNNGKTALHIAVQKCNPKIVVDLLSHEDIDATIMDHGGTPAAWELGGLMENAKTLNWNEVIMLMSKAYPQDAPSFHNLHMQAKQHMTSALRKDAKSLTQTYTSNTSLVAILISTITFAAAFTLPGGYSNDPGSEGLPIMSKKFAFQAFLISDVLAMCSSIAVAFICIIARWEDYEFLLYYRSFTKKLMWFAYLATTTAFSTGLYTVLAPHLHWLAITICVLVALVPIFTWLLGKWPILKLRFRLGKSFRSDLLSMV